MKQYDKQKTENVHLQSKVLHHCNKYILKGAYFTLKLNGRHFQFMLHSHYHLVVCECLQGSRHLPFKLSENKIQHCKPLPATSRHHSQNTHPSNCWLSEGSLPGLQVCVNGTSTIHFPATASNCQLLEKQKFFSYN